MLEAQDVTFAVGAKRLVDEADLVVPPGKVVSIVGPNGAGKSTLLKLLCGEIHPTEGTILLEGRDLEEVPAGELARRRAVVSQSTVLSFPFTVLEVALLGASVPGFGMRDEQMVALAMDSIEAVGLKGFEERLYTELSGGERQRVHIARALCQLEAPERPPGETAAFLLDEPTASLDFSHQSIVLGEARRQARLGRAVLVILHDLNLAAAYADEIVLMHRGRVMARGPAEEVLLDDLLTDVYGCPVRTNTVPADGVPFVLPYVGA
ncbi:heme ABC transporter ATP-binding protein [Methyloligella solikamskensis]|uniref:Heme ABC transporter ATP-binding protein n=1 Tax=Methyloligella solikamskensis TaxID=1177756 RepID=A0ABW3J9J9_9HYPH